MKRINWWQGQRVSFQELRKDSKDTEKAINSVLHTLARSSPDYWSDNPDWTVWGGVYTNDVLKRMLPTYLNGSSGGQSIFKATLTAISAVDNTVYISGNLVISAADVVFFRSGKVRTIPSGNWNFELTGSSDKASLTPINYDLYAMLCFNDDPVGPNTSGEITGYISSAYTQYRGDDGFIVNDDNPTEGIKVLLYDDVVSANLTSALSVVWFKQTNTYQLSSYGSEYDRTSKLDFTDYSNEGLYKDTFDRHENTCPIAFKRVLNATTSALITGTTATNLSGGISDAFYPTSHLIGIDGYAFENSGTGYNAYNYINYLKDFLDDVYHTEYLPSSIDWYSIASNDYHFTKNSFNKRTERNTSNSIKTLTLPLDCSINLSGVACDYILPFETRTLTPATNSRYIFFYGISSTSVTSSPNTRFYIYDMMHKHLHYSGAFDETILIPTGLLNASANTYSYNCFAELGSGANVSAYSMFADQMLWINFNTDSSFTLNSTIANSASIASAMTTYRFRDSGGYARTFFHSLASDDNNEYLYMLGIRYNTAPNWHNAFNAYSSVPETFITLKFEENHGTSWVSNLSQIGYDPLSGDRVVPQILSLNNDTVYIGIKHDSYDTVWLDANVNDFSNDLSHIGYNDTSSHIATFKLNNDYALKVVSYSSAAKAAMATSSFAWIKEVGIVDLKNLSYRSINLTLNSGFSGDYTTGGNTFYRDIKAIRCYNGDALLFAKAQTILDIYRISLGNEIFSYRK